MGKSTVREKMKVDLVMWAKDGAEHLDTVLARIEKVIPSGSIGQKIVIDDFSVDASREIAVKHGWTVFYNRFGGVANAANQALSHVSSEFFCCFEQDILLASDWFSKISLCLDEPDVACVQGIRVPTHPILRFFDKSLGYSIDNNVFRTKIVRDLGGFPVVCPVCTSRILAEKISAETPFKWVVDRSIVSLHIRNSLRDSIEHEYRISQICAGTPTCLPKTRKDCALKHSVRVLLTSPFKATTISLRENYPAAFWAYPLLVFYQLLANIKWRNQLG